MVVVVLLLQMLTLIQYLKNEFWDNRTIEWISVRTISAKMCQPVYPFNRFVALQVMLHVVTVLVGVQAAVTMMGTLTVEV